MRVHVVRLTVGPCLQFWPLWYWDKSMYVRQLDVMLPFMKLTIRWSRS